MKTMMKWPALLALVLLAAACASQKEPATKAVAEIEATVTTLRADADKYAATELKTVEDALASLKASLTSGDYKSVLAAAPAISTQLATLQQSVAEKKQQAEAAFAAATEQWQALGSEIPDMVADIQSRVDILGQSRRLPKNLSAESFQAAKDGLEAMKAGWSQANSHFSGGDPVAAVSEAQAAKDKGAEVLKLLGMG